LADDDAVNRTVVSALLKQLGLAVELASNGAEAVAAAAGASFDAILLDCLMPDPDGFETARRIRNSAPEGPRVPILALTALADGENREKCLAAGMDDFLAKPVTLDQLQRVLAKWLTAPPESGKPGAPPSGPLVLSRVEELRGLLGEQTWRETVESFLSDGRAKLAELRAAWDKKDATGVRDAAHYLKGSSANLGASAVAEAARRIEKAPSAGEVSAEMVARLEERFRDLERLWGGPPKV
jgi:CheY-like chemotaxis protein/HPt (histidine-containing phosphotransfer) domain-containing protein